MGHHALDPVDASTPAPASARMRVLAVANWDLDRVPTAWATMRVEALRRAGATVDILAIDCVSRRAGFVTLLRELRARLRDGDYDLVAPLYGSLLGLVCAVQQTPCALSFAGSDLNGTRRADGSLDWKSLGSRAFSQLAAALAGGVSVRTREMRDALWWPPARRRARVIGSGVDLARFQPRPRDEARRRRGLPLDGPRVVWVCMGAAGRPGKRLDLARAAVALVPGAALDVVDGVPLAEMPWAYSAADVMLFTSVQEGSPNCIKEALACGVPVVSVATGDVPEVVDGLTNCAITDDTPRALADAIARAISDGRGCPDGPARIRERHSMDRMIGDFVRFYEDVSDGG